VAALCVTAVLPAAFWAAVLDPLGIIDCYFD
jgi:hypothetical protein